MQWAGVGLGVRFQNLNLNLILNLNPNWIPMQNGLPIKVELESDRYPQV